MCSSKFFQAFHGNFSRSFSRIPPGVFWEFHRTKKEEFPTYSWKNFRGTPREVSGGIPEELLKEFSQNSRRNSWWASLGISEKLIKEFPRNYYRNSCRNSKGTPGIILGIFLDEFRRIFWRNYWETSWDILDKLLEECLEELRGIFCETRISIVEELLKESSEKPW